MARRRGVPLSTDPRPSSDSSATPIPAEDVAQRIIELARANDWTVGVAESLTGGLVVAELVAIPGASDVVRGGVVAYAPDLKRSLLNVPEAVLEQQGTVSRECAEAMSRGARETLGATFALSTTGVAGPEASEGHPPGTVHLAVCAGVPGREEVTTHQALNSHGSRPIIRSHATHAGLSLLLATLTAHAPHARLAGGGVR